QTLDPVEKSVQVQVLSCPPTLRSELLNGRRFLVPLCEPVAQEKEVGRIFFPVRHCFHTPAQTGRCKRDGNTVNFMSDRLLSSFAVVNSTGRSHKIDQHFISHTDYFVAL